MFDPLTVVAVRRTTLVRWWAPIAVPVETKEPVAQATHDFRAQGAMQAAYLLTGRMRQTETNGQSSLETRDRQGFRHGTHRCLRCVTRTVLHDGVST